MTKTNPIPYKALAAETIGTYLLTGMVLHSIGVGSSLFIATPYIAALTLAIMVATIGPISGAHINPAVTVAFAILKKISWQTAGLYIAAQTAGALIATFVITNIVLPDMTIPPAPMTLNSSIAEMLGAGLLFWGISSIITKKQEKQTLAPVIIGGSLLLGIAGAVPHSAGILNPAVALAITGINPLYIISPIIGAVISALLYDRLIKK